MVYPLCCSGPAAGGRAAPGDLTVGRAVARRVTAAAHARPAEDPAAGGRGEEGPEQQHTAQVSLRHSNTFIL